MNSLPQELVDTVIDSLPPSSLFSSSLVARRWRRRSQQRALEKIKFLSEDQVNRWCTDFPQDPEGIASYAHVARFEDIDFWYDPTTPGRALKSLGSLTELWLSCTKIPDELPGQISRGELGNGITALCLWCPSCTLATMTSFILSLPNLKVLYILGSMVGSEGPLQSHPVTSQRAPLDSLELWGDVGGIGNALVESGFTFRRLSLEVDPWDVEPLIMRSSETMVKLTLYDRFAQEIPHHTLSLPALTTLDIKLQGGNPSPQLITILSSISSAPALDSIAFEYDEWSDMDTSFQDPWVDMDRWLARAAEHTNAQGGLSAIFKRWPKGQSVSEGFLRDFRRAGGQVKIDVQR